MTGKPRLVKKTYIPALGYTCHSLLSKLDLLQKIYILKCLLNITAELSYISPKENIIFSPIVKAVYTHCEKTSNTEETKYKENLPVIPSIRHITV